MNINVCENPGSVAELRRTYEAVSQTLSYRTLEQFQGNDVLQLKEILRTLGFYRPGTDSVGSSRVDARFDHEVIEAVTAFRAQHGLSTPRVGSPPGLVDRETVQLLWREVERAGKAQDVRERIRRWTQTRR